MVDISDSIEKDLKKSADIAIDQLLSESAKSDSYLVALKEKLQEITESEKLLVIIDELDRCKPTFAVNMIEMVKHIFDVENVNFVLVVNREQLEAALEKHYGNGVDAKRYFDKFIRFAVNLPSHYKRGTDPNISHVGIRHFQLLATNSELLKSLFSFDRRRCSTTDLVYGLIKDNNLSLREVETLCRNLEIFQSISDDQHSFDRGNKVETVFRIIAIFLVVFEPEIAHNTARLKTAENILNWFKHDKTASYDDNTSCYNCLFPMALYLGLLTYDEKDELAKNSVDMKKWIEQVERITSFGHGDSVEPLAVILNTIDVISLKTMT